MKRRHQPLAPRRALAAVVPAAAAVRPRRGVGDRFDLMVAGTRLTATGVWLALAAWARLP